MLQQLLQLVEQNAQQSIIQNKAIPNQLNDAAIKEVSQQIFNGLKQQVAQGQLQQIITLFSASPKAIGSNPLVTDLANSVAASLSSRFGISQNDAQATASQLVPTVIQNVIRNSNDPKNIDFDLQQMMRTMSGNGALDISGMLPQPQKSVIGGLGNVFGKLFGK